MKAFQRDLFREIGRNKGRFLSVLFIVMLGAAFFSGIRSSKNDMRQSADTYYDDVNFMDIKVISTLGLTEDDLEDIIHIHFLASVHIPGLGIVAAWTMVQASGTIY